MKMAILSSEWDPDAAETDHPEEDLLVIEDVGGVTDEDALINTRGASVNYVRWDAHSLGAFCADKSSYKG